MVPVVWRIYRTACSRCKTFLITYTTIFPILPSCGFFYRRAPGLAIRTLTASIFNPFTPVMHAASSPIFFVVSSSCSLYLMFPACITFSFKLYSQVIHCSKSMYDSSNGGSNLLFLPISFSTHHRIISITPSPHLPRQSIRTTDYRFLFFYFYLSLLLNLCTCIVNSINKINNYESDAID